jgi:hypothetical protein
MVTGLKRKQENIISLIVCIAVFIVLLKVTTVESFVPWGIPADDGSSIQPFITSKTTRQDFRIPQDMGNRESKPLTQDYFWVYLDWDGSQTVREFILQLYHKVEIEIIVGDESKTITDWEVYAEVTVEIVRGYNEWQDMRFGLKKIDNNVFSDLTKADRVEKVVLLYRNLELEFYHKTSEAEVEQTKTLQQWNIEAWILIGWTFFLSLIAGASSKSILRKATYVPDLPPFYFWLLVALLLLSSTVIFLLISGENLDDIMRIVVLIPAPVLSVLFSLYFAFWLAAKFRPERLREMAFITIDMPKLADVLEGRRQLTDENELITDIDVLEGYINDNGDLEFINDPQNWWETIRRVKMGGIKFDIKKLGKRIRIRQRRKNYDDIIYCEHFEKQEVSAKIKDGALFSISSFIILLGIVTWIVPLIFGFANIIFSILGSVFLFSGILLFVWENVLITSPIITVVPITKREAVAIIRDNISLELKNQEIADLNLELFREKAMLSARSRDLTMKGLDAIGEAIMPLMELSKSVEESAETPEKLIAKLKDWNAEWGETMEKYRKVEEESENKGEK